MTIAAEEISEASTGAAVMFAFDTADVRVATSESTMGPIRQGSSELAPSQGKLSSPDLRADLFLPAQISFLRSFAS